jgi:hypothetical protein
MMMTGRRGHPIGTELHIDIRPICINGRRALKVKWID